MGARRLLFASDFSESSQEAVGEVAALAQHLGSEVIVTNVQSTQWRVWFSSRLDNRHRAERLELLAERFRARGVPARPEFAAEGDVARTLVGVAEFEDVDLIAIGATQRPSWPLRRSTAELLVRYARRPVWVSKPRARSAGPTHLLCGVDGSAASREALLLANDLVRRLRGRLSVVHAVGNPTFNPLGMAEAEVNEHAGAHRAEVERAITQFVRDARVDVEPRFLWGEPAQVLCAFAEEEGADAIVIGRTGKGALQHVLLGSTANQLLRDPCCSLLLLGEGQDPLFQARDLREPATHRAQPGASPEPLR